MKDLLKKYFFAALVAVYLLTALGLPVYLHYCGGEVEEVSCLVRTSSCCDGEEPADNGCCRDEGLLIQNSIDFTVKSAGTGLVQAVTQIFFLPRHQLVFVMEQTIKPFFHRAPAPPWQHGLLAEITVLRI